MAASVVVAAALLVGCTPTAAPGPSASPTAKGSAAAPAVSATADGAASPSPSPSPSLTPSVTLRGPLTLPSCPDLLPMSVVQTRFGPNAVALDVWSTASEVMAGPAAADAVSAAVSSEICAWGIPNSDGGFHVVAAELTPTAATSLIASLRTAGTFTEQATGARISFTRDLENEIGSYAVTYIFDRTAWVTAVGALTPAGIRPIGDAAMDAVVAANRD